MRIPFLVIVISATMPICGLLAQPVELEIMSRDTKSGWGARPPITKRTNEQALEALEQQGKIKPGEHMTSVHLNVEEEMPERQPSIYLTIHHTFDALPSGNLKERMFRWQERMQNGYDISRRDRKGAPYTLYAFPGDVPYHFLVSKDGEIVVGRELKFGVFSNTTYLDKPRQEMTPAELKVLEAGIRNRTDPPMLLRLWRNRAMPRHITVVLEGNFDEIKLEGNQRTNLVKLLVKLAREHSIAADHLTFHRDVATEYTGCPGKHVIEEMDNLRKEVAEGLR
jgi:hypothetical protein